MPPARLAKRCRHLQMPPQAVSGRSAARSHAWRHRGSRGLTGATPPDCQVEEVPLQRAGHLGAPQWMCGAARPRRVGQWMRTTRTPVGTGAAGRHFEGRRCMPKRRLANHEQPPCHRERSAKRGRHTLVTLARTQTLPIKSSSAQHARNRKLYRVLCSQIIMWAASWNFGRRWKRASPRASACSASLW